jgi:hypothetical protein
MTANPTTSTTAAREIDKNVRHDRRWLEQVTGREINTVLFTRKQFRVFSEVDDDSGRGCCVLSLRGLPE